MNFQIHKRKKDLCCSESGSCDFVRKGTVTRSFRAVPIGFKLVLIVLAVQRVLCRTCNNLKQVKTGFADLHRRYTRQLERYALELSRYMIIQDVAAHLKVSWDVINDIQKRNLTGRFGRPKLRKLEQIAVDEICIGHGPQYLKVVLDLPTVAVVFVGDGKGPDVLEPFWKRLKGCRAKLRAVAIEMSLAYIRAVCENLPGVAVVFDHFHIVKLLNEKLSDLRRLLYRKACSKRDKDFIKGTCWLLLKNPENLDERHNEKQRLQKALELNKPLAAAYYTKEDLRKLLNRTDKQKAYEFLTDWIYRSGSSGIDMFRRFAKTLTTHLDGILTYYDYRISTGPLEGTNNKIKTMKRQAYGFRDIEFFKLKIMGVHATRYTLVGLAKIIENYINRGDQLCC